MLAGRRRHADACSERHCAVKLFQSVLQRVWTAASAGRPSLADVKVRRMRVASRSLAQACSGARRHYACVVRGPVRDCSRRPYRRADNPAPRPGPAGRPTVTAAKWVQPESLVVRHPTTPTVPVTSEHSCFVFGRSRVQSSAWRLTILTGGFRSFLQYF
jgi:hypothetical protein